MSKDNQQEQEIITDPEETAKEEELEQEVLEEEQAEDEELEKLKQDYEELNNRLIRLQADYDNFRRRTMKEREADRKYKSQDLVTELVPVLDNFDRALKVEVEGEAAKGFVDGMKMVYQQFKAALEKEGVEEIKAEGEQFDPHLHQAVMQANEEDYDSNVVIEEMQKGYKLKDRVIRPAMVKVNQ
ncbi:protein GrpE [Thalassobacillus devorans]|uniref:Protein GrpE n=1 Tax=Thalassobacillus devorans TaxID=279813 RepID=A0ABQ1P8B8_9BACI|nr:nucleotide exchange factor GrpE [Thalassobacillus devorans]NIK29706.1 molecular chaperone GrpE [Thalassobacillus devorans]GGC92159.1 protein GrpE [Thalassobacillus devorans]